MIVGPWYRLKRVVALRKESVDRNTENAVLFLMTDGSLSARRAWIEIRNRFALVDVLPVALRKESVDRNIFADASKISKLVSLSARRAWIEIGYF